jgi:outer membrane usher protein
MCSSKSISRSPIRYLQYCMWLCGSISASQIEAKEFESAQDEYVFDTSMFRGSNINQNKMLKLSQQDVLAGRYPVDVYLNRQFIEKTELNFVEKNQQVIACLTPQTLEHWGILLQQNSSSNAEACADLSTLAGAGQLYFDHSKMRVDIQMPQTHLKQQPRGYVAPELWDAGESIAYLNYATSYYYNAQNSSNLQNTDNAYVSLQGGINFGKWQFRQQSNLQYQNGQTDFNVLRSYIKRPFPYLSSELSLGQLNSSGRLFSGLNYTGAHLKSDERMLPDSQRGYAPTILGIAQTMARVSVKQNGREIYQTTVAAGPFKITDLYPTSYNGDLEVTIFEADGRQSQFKVPFNAIPESVRAGHFKYELDLGKTQDTDEKSPFVTLSTQYGLNNAITVNSGIRVADGYQAAVLGTAFNNRFGAFGVDTTYSHAELGQQGTEDGWMLGLSYSKNLMASNTSLAIAGYHFSTEGYRDLVDVLNQRDTNVTQNIGSSTAQRSRFTTSINQNLGKYGMLTLSGSAQNYYDNRDDDYQLQLGYGKTLSNGTSLNLNVAHQTYQNNLTDDSISNKAQSDTTMGMSVTFPLAKNKARAQDVNLAFQQNESSRHYQAQISGFVDQAQSMNYHVGVNYDDDLAQSSLNANLQKRWSNLNTNVSAAISDDAWQVSGSVQGAVALHKGGVTFGPHLGDTFALVEAKGAQGARLANTQNTKINKHGYALVPALTPYRFNSIALNPEGMSEDVDLDIGEQKVVPYAGASLKVNFATHQGQAVLLHVKTANDEALPLGADVLDHEERLIAVVGQNSQIYFRAEQPQGRLNIVWGEEADERCSVDYDTTQGTATSHFLQLQAQCTGE